jgi:hypothetical protein
MARRVLPFLALLLAACGTSSAKDDHLDAGPPTVLGAGQRIKEILDPTRADHDKIVNQSVQVTGASVLWTDTFDETSNGKSRGTVYVQDVGSTDPYSGTSLYSPTFVPGDLRPAPGDVLDLNGTYQENKNIGSAVFPAPQVLPQISKPVGTLRYEFAPPPAVEIDVNDLDDYTKGRRWLNMLVTVKNVTLIEDMDDEGIRAQKGPTGRVTAHMTAKSSCKLVNELMAIAPGAYKAKVPIKSVTGVITYFYDLHLAPRTQADIVQ